MVIIKVKANLSSTGTGLPTGTELGNIDRAFKVAVAAFDGGGNGVCLIGSI